VQAWRRADPCLIVSCLREVGPEHDATWARQGLLNDSLGVSWAGIDPAPLWFDAARDLTEYWVHERQMRDAVGRPDDDPAALAATLDVFARGLPFTLERSEPLGARAFRLVADPPGPSATALERAVLAHVAIVHSSPDG
jgi:hypothetical protein